MAVSLFLASIPAWAQITQLPFRPIAADYTSTLDRVVAIASSPNQVHLYNALDRTDKTVTLPAPPLNMALAIDGVHLAVAHSDSISYVNLQSLTIEKTFQANVGKGTVAISPGYIHVLFSTYPDGTYSINMGTGAQTPAPSVFYGGPGTYNPRTAALYGTRDGTSPNDIEKYDVSTGPITRQTDSPYHGDYSVCGPVWLSPDFKRIYSGCATIFQASTDPALDMTYYGAIPGLLRLQSLYDSTAAGMVAVIPATLDVWYTDGASQQDNEVRIYNSAQLTYTGRIALPPFTVNGKSFPAHGKWVFYNQAGTHLIVLSQADGSAGLLNDYVVETVALQSSQACSISLSQTSLSAGYEGGIQSLSVTGNDPSCYFKASTQSDWIALTGGVEGAGGTTLTYMIRPNSKQASRTGTITIGDATLTIDQSAAPSVPAVGEPRRLSFNVVTAAYNRQTNSVIMIAANPNELHIYDPGTQSDRWVALDRPPLSLSVTPDGTKAAVGHSGLISLVNLQSGTVDKTFVVNTDVAGITIAANGYIYAFPQRDWSDIYSLEINSSKWTSVGAIYNGRVPTLHPSGRSIYVGGNWTSKWSIVDGPLSLQNSFSSASSCGHWWITEDGLRLISACGQIYRSSDSPADDFAPNGTLASVTNGITWADHSSTQGTIAVITSGQTNATAQGQLQLYADNGLALQSNRTLPAVTIGGTAYPTHGRFLFWNSDATRLIVIAEVDSSAKQLSNYVVLAQEVGCSVLPAAHGMNVSSAGGTIRIPVSSNAGCSWNVTSASDWLVPIPESNAVRLDVPANTSSTPRQGTIVIADQAVRVSQAAANECTFMFAPAGALIANSGGSGSLQILTGASCPWRAASDSTWLQLAGATSGTGPATVTYNVASNVVAVQRAAAISIGGQSFSVTQAGVGVPASPALRLVPMTPCRALDTRLADGKLGGPSLLPNTYRDFNLTSSNCGVPASARAYSLNVSVVPKAKLGYLTMWPTGETQPFVSTVNSTDGRIKTAAAIMPAGNDGAVSIYATDATEVIIDINGYFVDAGNTSAMAYYPVAPCRLVDTRLETAALGGPSLVANTARAFPLRQGSCGIPETAKAYALNFAAVPRGSLGYLTAWPNGQPQPLAATLTAPTGTITANAAIVPSGYDGGISVFSTDATDLVIDINGYFAPPVTGGLDFYAMPPCRALDTRSNGMGAISGDATLDLTANSCGLPSAASAVALNATVVPTNSLGYLTLQPANAMRRIGTATLNAPDGTVTSNLALLGLADRKIAAFTSDPSQLIVDLFGYFSPLQ